MEKNHYNNILKQHLPLKSKLLNQKYWTNLALLGVLGAATLMTPSCSETEQEESTRIELQEKNQNYREQEGRFDSPNLTEEVLAPDIVITRDAGVSFYTVKNKETLRTIRQKLAQTEEFSYLKHAAYAPANQGRNINSFNIIAKDLKAGMKIPIPLSKEQREISDEEFYQMSLEAIDELCQDPRYGKRMQKIIQTVPRETIAKTMCAYAKSETSGTASSDKIGAATLHRREPHRNAYSFSYYHILMEKNADGRSNGP